VKKEPNGLGFFKLQILTFHKIKHQYEISQAEGIRR